MSNDDEDNLSVDCGPKFSPPLYLQRYETVRDLLLKENPPIKRLADFGCAEGRFLRYLKQLPFVEEVAAVDINELNLEESDYFAAPLAWDHLFGRFVALTVNLYQGNVVQPDCRLKGIDAVTCIELVEHLNADVLEKFPANVFGYFKPRLVIITTPNSEFNVLFPQLKAKQFRHWDHKFEWTREEFRNWCATIVGEYWDYEFEITGVGAPPADRTDVGFCTQIAVFRRVTENSSPDERGTPCSYRLFNSYYYHQRKKDEVKEEFVQIDWDSVLN